MPDHFIAEIRMVGFNFPPTGWALCDGQLLPIAQNTALFSLLGITYGGNGTTNFAVPNLQGRAPMQPGQGPGLSLHDLGETGGTASVALLTSEIPNHTHSFPFPAVNAAATSVNPANALPAIAGENVYNPQGTPVNLSPHALGPTGASQPHNNLQPYLVVNFIIALQGIFPPRS